MRVAVVDYGLANIRSVVNALECFDISVILAKQGDALHGAEKIDQNRHVIRRAVLADDVFKQHRRAALGQ